MAKYLRPVKDAGLQQTICYCIPDTAAELYGTKHDVFIRRSGNILSLDCESAKPCWYAVDVDGTIYTDSPLAHIEAANHNRPRSDKKVER